ncbi:MAG: AmmeMemoRadiSam system protein B [Spirochaetales bacterium]|nr:AmmeMemoRadiSam system protein B [Spirochaetales bacterium]
METRPRSLPSGWYPGGRTETERKIEALWKKTSPRPERAWAGIVPHAGWDYSGRAALEVILSVRGPVDTWVVVGGHLPARAGVLAASEDAFETPLGPLPADRDLLGRLRASLTVREDAFPDNTVEIQLPFIKYAWPDCSVLWLRAAPSEEAIVLGETLARLAADMKKKVVVLGSTDLTHYGESYGFTPMGRGERAVKWVKEKNDKKLIDLFLALDIPAALKAAAEDSSACSAGGAATAAAYARARGAKGGTLLSYYTSYDVFPHESFVGYAGILFPA